MGNLNKKDYENWRFGQVPYLEKVMEGSLSKISRQLRIIQLHAKDCGLKPSYEFAYSMHYVSETRKNTDKSTIPRKVEGCDEP